MKRILVSLVFLIIASASSLVMAQADGSAIYVCRDSTYETVRHEFHNIPAEWFSGETVNIWLLVDGSEFYPELGIVITDALVAESPGMQNEGVEVGQSILGITDYSFQITGDINSPACDIALSPGQNTSVPSSLPSTSIPVSVNSCNYPELRAWDSGKGIYYCYNVVNALGVIPIPAAPVF